jgi:hypothetical protein
MLKARRPFKQVNLPPLSVLNIRSEFEYSEQLIINSMSGFFFGVTTFLLTITPKPVILDFISAISSAFSGITSSDFTHL